ncbi:MAG: PTS sugar transporter subunit IIA [Actinobacteria bacterium]|nr:PTS sugar transporter subunit IIA [Actinomycetota bacterium]
METTFRMTNFLQLAGIRLGATASSREEAVRLCGELLHTLGAVNQQYIDAMWERENIISSYMGEQVALPHGTDDSRKHVNFAQLVFVRFSEPVDWDGEAVKLCIGIAAKGDEHGELLGNLAEKLLDKNSYKTLMETTSTTELLELINV